MLQSTIWAVLGACVAPVLCAQEDPYYANETFLPPRTLNVGSNLTVTTQTGTYIGMYNDTYPNVRQFLRVPFAQVNTWPNSKSVGALSDIGVLGISHPFGPNCAQYVPSTESFWNEYAPTNQVSSLGQRLDDGGVSWSSAEDCLTLAIWTPAYANKTSNLPVALFVSGGGMITGGVDIPSQLPTNWVSRSQEHIAITVNYRLNIFGSKYPIARALNGTSFQLQDVRAAVEWVNQNIGAFGGDPENIFLWGQSAGATLTHYYTLAYPDYPLAKRFGVISSPETETVTSATLAKSNVYDQFDSLSKAMGCDYGTDYDAQLNCMRQISWVQLSEFTNNFNFTPGVPYDFAYLPPDETYIFSNETERYEKGLVAPGPLIRSDALREMPSVNTTAVYDFALSGLCFSLNDAVRRKQIGLETYKYMWAGNFSNISPVPWLGAFHWTDLLMIMGTYPTDRAPGSTISSLEVETSHVMQDYMLAFTKDPNSLPRLGWPSFNANATEGGMLLEFGNGTAVKNVTGDKIWGACTFSNDTVPLNG